MDVVDHFLPVAEESAYVDGRLMGLPTSIEGTAISTTRDLFAQAGIDEVPETFSELEAAAEQLAAAGITPFVSGYGTWWVTANHQLNIPFACRTIRRVCCGPQQRQRLDGGQRVLQDLQKLIDLVRSNTMGDPLSQDHHMQVSLFASEEAAMIQQGNWKEAAILDANPDIDMGLVPLAITEDAAQKWPCPRRYPVVLCRDRGL